MAEANTIVTNFNSFKTLAHYDRMKAIMTGHFQAPVTVEIDPVVACNHGCWFCIAEQFMAQTPTKMKMADADAVIRYLRRFGAWGVRGIVFVGGGEPTLHPRINDMIRAAGETGLEIGMITNGSRLHLIDDEIIEFLGEGPTEDGLGKFRWVGCSIDAATAETHSMLHVTSLGEFGLILSNMERLVKAGMPVTYKYVLSPWNLKEAAKAIEVAADIGCKEVYYRPAYMGMYENTPDLINRAKDAGKDLMYTTFERFWGQVQKTIPDLMAAKERFNDKLDVIVSVKKVEDFFTDNRSPRCHATPLICVMSGDNKIHLCCDRREEEFLTLCDYTQEDLLEVWGSKRHLEIIDKIDVKHCPRCRLEIHNQILCSMPDDAMQINFI